VTLPRFLAPAGSTIEHFSISYGSTRGRTTRPIVAGPFAGRVALEQVLMVNVVLRDTLTGRPCGSTDRYVIPSIPLTSFPLFGTAPTTRWSPPLAIRRVNDGAPSLAHLNGNKTGSQISSSDFSFPGPQFSGDPVAVDLVDSTRGNDQVLSPAVGTPAMSAAQSSLERSFRWLVEPPQHSDSKALGDARLAEKADIVVVDGVWYNNRDKARPWPGVPLWSDRPGSAVDHVSPADAIVDSTAKVGIGDLGFAPSEFPQLFSWYDRSSATTVIRSQLTGGVLSYGPLAVLPTGTSCASDADCGGFECFRPTSAAGTCQRLEPGLWPAPALGCGDDFQGVSQCNGGSADAVVDGARSGFRDDERNILPVNLNLEALARAVLATDATTDKNELGQVLGGPGNFNGVIYVTGRFSGGSLPEVQQTSSGVGPASLCERTNGSSTSLGACPGASSNNVHRPRSNNNVPIGLCGTGANLSANFATMACNNASRPNAVRIYNAGRIPAGAFPRGLTIATDLPLYVQGDLNRVLGGSPPQPHIKVAVVADRVTFLSRGWRDGLHPWNDDAITTGAPATGTMIVEASIISGLPLRSGNTHDIGDVFRTPQDFSDNHFVLRGHLVAAFNSEYDERDESGDRVGRGLRWLSDYHLNNPGYQPPGMPLVTLPVASRWRQR